MWGNKKPDAPQPGQPEQRNPISNQPSRPAPAAWEEKPAMSTDAMRPLGGTADRGTARLGASLHVKGEISGNEDLVIDGSVEGLVQLDERKLTVGATAKVTADIIAREVVVFGTDRKSTRLNSSHVEISYAVFCLKKKKKRKKGKKVDTDGHAFHDDAGMRTHRGRAVHPRASMRCQIG